MKGLTISRITISIAMGTALVMGALMDGPTKPLANQAFAATPCSLTVGNEGTTTISGKLVCGGQGLGHATIHLTLHHITTGRTTTATAVTEIPDGSYDHAVVLGAGHSYTADAKYDGDSDHQPAFATTSINIPGPTGSTQGTSNAGNGQGTSNAGNGQGTSNAGNGQQNNSTQASFTVPCSLTVGPTPNENPISSIEGKLTCGGVGESGATIQISGLPGGSDSRTTANGGSYELGIFSPFSPGQSYTVTAKYDGNSDQHLQPASATTIINIPGPTGSTQDTSNAGSTPQNNNAGNGQDTSNAGSTPQNNNAGNGQDTSNAGNSAG
jgi:hypothetical protein